MGSFIFQLFNLIIVLAVLAVPIIITVLVLRHLSSRGDSLDEYEQELLTDRIRELERRIEILEDRWE